MNFDAIKTISRPKAKRKDSQEAASEAKRILVSGSEC